jgi:predicted transposase/invertase (TIGR01784 family)
MKESPIYQDILLEGLAKGKAEGLAKGEAEAVNQIAARMLLSDISPDLIAQFTGLSSKQIQKLKKISAKQSQSPKSSKSKR